MVCRVLADSDPGLQEQALYILRNFTDCEEDIELVFEELGSNNLLGLLEAALQSKAGDVVHQVKLLSLVCCRTSFN